MFAKPTYTARDSLPKEKIPVWCLIILIISSGGCGYQFTVEGPGPVIGGAQNRPTLGPPIRLAIHILNNRTFEPNLEIKYTRYLRQAFQSGGVATVVEDDRSADFVLEGAIASVTIPSLAFSQIQTQESRVRVKVAVKVKDRKTGKSRWAQTTTQSAEFFVGASSTGGTVSTGLQFNRVLQDRALEQAGQRVAEDLADGFLSAQEQGKFDAKPQIPLLESEDSSLPSKSLLPSPKNSSLSDDQPR